jgi:hypothetical protein
MSSIEVASSEMKLQSEDCINVSQHSTYWLCSCESIVPLTALGQRMEHEVNVGLVINPLTPEFNPSAQRCLTRFFTQDFASWTVQFVNIRVCVKNQQMQQLFIQFINYVW